MADNVLSPEVALVTEETPSQNSKMPQSEELAIQTSALHLWQGAQNDAEHVQPKINEAQNGQHAEQQVRVPTNRKLKSSAEQERRLGLRLPSMADFLAVMTKNPEWRVYNPEFWKILPPSEALGPVALAFMSQTCLVPWPKAAVQAEPTFTPFPRLPAELRLKIWECALPDARVVPFRRRSHKVGIERPLYTLDSNERRLTGAHLACWESWTVFLEHYQKIKLWKGDFRVSDGKYNFAQGYFDMKRDTLFITHALLHSLRSILDLRLLQHIAVGVYKRVGSDGMPLWYLATCMCPELVSYTYVPTGRTRVQSSKASLREYRLIEADDLKYTLCDKTTDFHDLSKFQSTDDNEGFLNQYLRIVPFIQQQIDETIEQFRKSPDFRIPAFKICVLMLQEPANHGRWLVQKLDVAPVDKREHPLGVTFHTYKPIVRDVYSMLCLKDAVASYRVFYMKPDGALVSCYDDVREIFDEDKLVDTKKESEGVLQLIRLKDY
ncbi:uncharacterized protein LY89DRAFT_727588 [Mollisia scopiformis]|uniref:2EXR domain-containing protein n=1 Tax=Mollisia scopiformis TaxID=149040 RepID=A0A194XWQ4_MOLSC|nr:uncharacterized protein LY89DRAFT_727588 [Mollisia scopiformis]KUJ24566.1 hypothetical protein LY89DRAFT_727588 [Mollisia scopiformis]